MNDDTVPVFAHRPLADTQRVVIAPSADRPALRITAWGGTVILTSHDGAQISLDRQQAEDLRQALAQLVAP